jgi:hypothetical protein
VPTFWARWGDVTVSDEMVLLETKLGPGRDLIESIARRKAAAAMAWERGLQASEREVAQALDELYAGHGLNDPDAIRAWRATHHLKEEAIRSFLREQHLIERLKSELVTEEAIERRFRQRASDHRQADLDVFTFESEVGARAFIEAVESGEIEPRLGERHRLSRSQWPPAIAEALTSASEGALFGPVEARRRVCHVYRLVRWEQPTLDGAFRETIREELFREALEPVLSREPLTYLA